MEVIADGEYWRIIVNEKVPNENEVDWNSGQFGKSGYKAGLGYDTTPPAGYKLGYLKFPMSEWSKEELESAEYQDQLSRMAKKCNVCSTLDHMRANAPQKPSEVQLAPVETKPHIGNMAEPRRLSAGDVIAPTYIPKLAKLGEQVFCTPLGKLGMSTIGSVIFDLFSGWSTDPGQRAAMKQISDELIDMEVDPNTLPEIQEDALRLYESWQKGGVTAAVKSGFFKQFDQAVKDGIGINVDTTTRKRTSIGIRKGVSNLSVE